MAYNILIADDETEIVELLALYFEKDGNTVFKAENGAKALEIVNHEQIDCALLDVMMPEFNGFQLLKKIREEKDIPVLMITARVASSDKILGLDLGADDYITKPFDPVEVVARVNANIRRFKKLLPAQNSHEEAESESALVFENIRLDTNGCTLSKDGSEIEITSTEFKILALLMASPGKVFTKSQISEAGWGENFYVEDNSIMVALSKLRAKLGKRVKIKNIRGLGWRLEKSSE
ncbi:MAG: response regulator transcription factor [Treponema sp.]|nr:response regulator transcription factor [Treponema sp.]